MRRIGNQHLGHAVELGGFIGHCRAIAARHENVNVGTHFLGCRDGLRGRRSESLVGVLGENQNRHQSTPASVFSFCTSSATSATFTPPFRCGGSAVFRT